MSKKRKKKKSGLTEHQQKKIDNARRFNTYIIRAQKLIRDMGLKETLAHLTKNDYWLMFQLRTHPVKLDLSRASLFDLIQRKALQDFFFSQFRVFKTPLLENEEENKGREMSITDFYEVWLPLSTTISQNFSNLHAELNDADEARLVKDLSKLQEEDLEDDKPVLEEILNNTLMALHYRIFKATDVLLQTFCVRVSNPISYYLYKEESEVVQHNNNHRIGLTWSFITMKSEPQTLSFKGEKRRAFQVKNMFAPKYDVSVKIPYHPVFNTNPEKVYNVFVLEHAIRRLYERIDAIENMYVNFYMNISLLEFDAGWFKGSLMINYKIGEHKLGYFVADIVQNKILIRTFLFITYNKTFEGELLNSRTGFEKLDKKYLNIDKLSTFLASKIEKNSFAGKIFTEANCEHLLNLDSLKSMSDPNPDESTSITNEFLMKYLDIEEDT